MKKIIFATLFCLFLCGSLFAQQQVMTLHGGKTTLGQVFKEIESQAGLSVDYDAQEVNITQTVTVPDGNATVKALLDAVLEGPGYSYTSTIRGSHVIIKAKKAQQKQTLTVSGRVVDSKGEPLAGVGVLIKGTISGTVTGFDGTYTINVPENSTIVFSSMGYKDVEEVVGNHDPYDLHDVVRLRHGEEQYARYGNEER